jgi:ribose transport system substrate-binding protein
MTIGLRHEGHQMEVILTAGEFDPARQHHQVSEFITRRVDALVLSPCDSKAIGTAIAEANKAGIPVFTVDIAALDLILGPPFAGMRSAGH